MKRKEAAQIYMALSLTRSRKYFDHVHPDLFEKAMLDMALDFIDAMVALGVLKVDD